MRERTDDERDSAAEEFYREPVERLARETAERLKPWTLEQRIAQWREQSQLSQRDAEMARRVDDGAQGMYLDGRAFAFERCADEADTALRACAEAPAPKATAAIENLNAVIGVLEEGIENEEFGRALRRAGAAKLGKPYDDDDETPMPFTRCFKAEVDYMREQINTLRAEAPATDTGWRPIATVPHDGRMVLVYPSSCWTDDTEFDYEVTYWDAQADYRDGQFIGALYQRCSPDDFTGFTHWMPLPASPRAEALAPSPDTGGKQE